jgi:hypothetical protein
VNLFSVLCGALQGIPFFVSAQDEEELLKLLRSEDAMDYKLLSTTKIVDHQPEREVVVSQLQLSLTLDMCVGCPAYISMFERVCDLAQDAQDNAAIKSQFSRLKAVVDISRHLMRSCFA